MANNFSNLKGGFMETRIRYSRVGNTLTSNRTFEVNGSKVQVTINLEAHTYEIKNVATGEVLKTGKEKTPAYVKKAAKSAMHSLGMAFSNEKRVRGAVEATPAPATPSQSSNSAA
jgi:hypothetical protein